MRVEMTNNDTTTTTTTIATTTTIITTKRSLVCQLRNGAVTTGSTADPHRIDLGGT